MYLGIEHTSLSWSGLWSDTVLDWLLLIVVLLSEPHLLSVPIREAISVCWGTQSGPRVRHNTMWMWQSEPSPESCCFPLSDTGGEGLSQKSVLNNPGAMEQAGLRERFCSVTV